MEPLIIVGGDGEPNPIPHIEGWARVYRKHMEKPFLMKFFEDAKSVVKDVLKEKSS